MLYDATWVLTQLFKGLLHVQFSVDMTGIRRQQREVLTLGCVAVHLHIDAHRRQRLLGLEDCRDGRAVQQAHLWGAEGEEEEEDDERRGG